MKKKGIIIIIKKVQAFNKYLGVPREIFPEFFTTISISHRIRMGVMALKVKLYRKYDIQGHVAGTGKLPVMTQNSHPDHTSSLVQEKVLDNGTFIPMRESERLRCVRGE